MEKKMEKKKLTDLTAFLKKLEPERFDFKHLMREYYECYAEGNQDNDTYMTLLRNLPKLESGSSFEKWFRYKTLDKNLDKKIKRFDCDNWNGTCELTKQVYERLWGWKRTQGTTFGTVKELQQGSFGGDTMNSFATVLNAFARTKSFEECAEKYEIDSAFRQEIDSAFNDYALATSFIGNFVLVPEGFNGKRARPTSDFWDSSLVWLKKDGFGDFDRTDFNKYVNYFFLWDYVRCHKETYAVKPLFSSHAKIEEGSIADTTNWCGLVPRENADHTEQIKENACEFMSNAIRFIIRRGIFMTAMLQLQYDENVGTLYDEFRRDVFAVDTRYNGYGDVIKKIDCWLDERNIGMPEKVKNTLEKLKDNA